MKEEIFKEFIKGDGYYYALLCDKTICGVFSEKEEAVEYNREINECSRKHKIKKCKVIIKI